MDQKPGIKTSEGIGFLGGVTAMLTFAFAGNQSDTVKICAMAASVLWAGFYTLQRYLAKKPKA